MENRKNLHLDTNIGLELCGGSKETYLQILSFVEEFAEEKMENIGKSLKDKDWEWYEREVHSLKSSMASIGACPLSEYAKKHEIAAKELNTIYIEETVSGLLEEYKTILSEIEKYKKQGSCEEYTEGK